MASKFLQLYVYDLLLGSVAAFYVLMVPYTKLKKASTFSMIIWSFQVLFLALLSVSFVACKNEGIACVNFRISNCISSATAEVAKDL
ncbi:hypothetical protein F3Y22_tig00001120pilonHSYRG00019 [Hibiscus syriacus]|uniref:Uncharacterized protein n=1 Tax=Hibiscus syriacus TaxID=106335 RepID=A0A6A3CV72_HIBSY|nr:hypothetical protein F3Y22_tig00001120pilonHSYRG00019 [Hibiscus syriacus]